MTRRAFSVAVTLQCGLLAVGVGIQTPLALTLCAVAVTAVTLTFILAARRVKERP